MGERTCTISDCTGKLLARGMCAKHYQRWRSTGNAYHIPQKAKSKAERFWEKVDADGDCWEWTGGLDWDGYGIFGDRPSSHRAHRWSYEVLVGPIPPGLQIDHLCRSRRCVNPTIYSRSRPA